MGNAAQKRNAALISLLRADFQHHTDPPKTLRLSTAIAGAVPTDAELDSVTNITPATAPAENMMFFVEVSGVNVVLGQEMFLVMADKANAVWRYSVFTTAV